jgi:hypothetical protein
MKLAITASFALSLLNCSYGASFDDCQIICRSPDECPNGLTCGTEGLCRTSSASQTCSSSKHDAPPSGLDGPVVAGCSGNATACTVLSGANDCNKQDGCGFTTTKCTNVTDCSIHATNTSCTADNACFTDFTTSTCKPKAGYCMGADRTDCEGTTGCKFSGGCVGTAAACTAYSSQSSCVLHAGCGWH